MNKLAQELANTDQPVEVSTDTTLREGPNDVVAVTVGDSVRVGRCNLADTIKEALIS